jgi:hypothetical protein
MDIQVAKMLHEAKIRNRSDGNQERLLLEYVDSKQLNVLIKPFME